MPARLGTVIIENVQPQVDGGRYPVKRAAGETVRVTADVFKEGHDELAVVLRWRQLTPNSTEPREVAMRPGLIGDYRLPSPSFITRAPMLPRRNRNCRNRLERTNS